jgi:hypothetical protein
LCRLTQGKSFPTLKCRFQDYSRRCCLSPNSIEAELTMAADLS